MNDTLNCKRAIYCLVVLITFALLLIGCGSEQTIDHEGGTYTGKVKDDLPHGQGKWTGVDRNLRREVIYIGEFKEGKFEGKGTLTSLDGHELYVGEWKLGFMHGQGIYNFGPPAGSDTFTTESRIKYEGEWALGVPHGQGTMTYRDGRKVTGRWERGEYMGP